jgi:hypothetical protein
MEKRTRVAGEDEPNYKVRLREVVYTEHDQHLTCREVPDARQCQKHLGLAEVTEDRVDELKGLVDLFTDLGTSEDDLARDKDEEDDLGLHHAIDETWEQLRLVRRESVMTRGEAFETDRELDVARADNVLDLEVGELGVEAELLDDARVLARSKAAVILALGARDDHLARCEDQSGSLGLADTHDDSSETLRVVLCIARMKSDGLQIETSRQVDRRDNVLESRDWRQSETERKET